MIKIRTEINETENKINREKSMKPKGGSWKRSIKMIYTNQLLYLETWISSQDNREKKRKDKLPASKMK